MKTINLLFTSVGRRVELLQQFRAAANRLGIRLCILGAEISYSAPALCYCDKTVIVPRISNDQYIPTLIDICISEHVDLVIPTIDTDLLKLASSKKEFDNIGTRVLISRPDKIKLCRDKRFTGDYFRSLGLDSPTTVDSVESYTGPFPAFIKPADGSSSVGAYRVNNIAELRFHASMLSNYIIQPFVSGIEYTVDVFCDFDGDPVYITPRIRQAVRSGEVLRTMIDHQKSIENDMLRLVGDYKPCGPITVQLIRDIEGVNHYIEINPRFGGGAPLSMKAGADAAEALLRLMCDEKLCYSSCAASNGDVYSRYDQSVRVSFNKARSVKAVVFDLDDTLYSEKEYVRSGYRAVAEVVPELKNAENELWEAFLNGEQSIDFILNKYSLFSEELKQSCLSVYREHSPDIKLYDGAVELLEELRSRGIKTGIITDGRPIGQRAKIDALSLKTYVNEIIVTDELGGACFRKPNDIAFRIMQTRFGVPFDSILYVGDNAAKDFLAPKALGMQWIHFNNYDGLYFDNENCVDNQVDSFSELSKALLERCILVN